MKNKWRVMLLFTMTYFTGYLMRTNLVTVIAEMVSDTGYAKSLLSVCLIGSFFTYAAGQLVSGFLGDKFSPKRLVQIGLVTSVVMNLLLPLSPSLPVMVAVWSVNGFAQAFLWPPIVKMMTVLFDRADYRTASVMVSFGSTLGPILLYLLCPLVISVSAWRTVFFLSAACGIVMTVLFSVLCPEVSRIPPAIGKDRTEEGKGSLPAILFPVLFAVILQGALKDGITTWTPSYLDETFRLGSRIAILVSVILPVFATVCFTAAARIYARLLRNPMVCAGVFFAVGFLSALLLRLTRGRNTLTDVLLIALLVGAMHGVNMILISMIPGFFAGTRYVSFLSGLLNCCSYIGSALSTYGVAAFAERTGWNSTVLLWCFMALTGAFLCFVCAGGWRKHFPTAKRKAPGASAD